MNKNQAVNQVASRTADWLETASFLRATGDPYTSHDSQDSDRLDEAIREVVRRLRAMGQAG